MLQPTNCFICTSFIDQFCFKFFNDLPTQLKLNFKTAFSRDMVRLPYSKKLYGQECWTGLVNCRNERYRNGMGRFGSNLKKLPSNADGLWPSRLIIRNPQRHWVESLMFLFKAVAVIKPQRVCHSTFASSSIALWAIHRFLDVE